MDITCCGFVIFAGCHEVIKQSFRFWLQSKKTRTEREVIFRRKLINTNNLRLTGFFFMAVI
jgi:hypothetical protein